MQQQNEISTETGLTLQSPNQSAVGASKECRSIPPATPIQLHKLGFKLLPLSANNAVVMPWTPIYEDPNFWSLENIVSESPEFKNVATVFGKTHVKDSEGKDLHLNGLDC